MLPFVLCVDGDLIVESALYTDSGTNVVPAHWTVNEQDDARDKGETFHIPDNLPDTILDNDGQPVPGQYSLTAAFECPVNGATLAATETIKLVRLQSLTATDASDTDNDATTVYDGDPQTLYVPYTEDDQGNSTTSVNLSAVPNPGTWPDGKPVWTLVEQPEGSAPLPDSPGAAFTYTAAEPGFYTFTAECGNELKVNVVFTVPELCLVRKPDMVPVICERIEEIKEEKDQSLCGMLYVYVKARKARAEMIKNGITIETLKYEGPAAERDLSLKVDGPLTLGDEQDDYFLFTQNGETEFNQFFKIRLYAHVPGGYKTRLKLYGNIIDSGYYEFLAVSARMRVSEYENHPKPINVKGAVDETFVMPLKYMNAAGKDVVPKAMAKLQGVAAVTPGPWVSTDNYKVPKFLNAAGETFLEWAKNEESEFEYRVAATTEGDGKLRTEDDTEPPGFFEFNTKYQKQMVQYVPGTGTYRLVRDWYAPNGIEITKKAMIQPLRIICPDLGIADIEETEQNADNVDIVVFDDQTPNDYNNTVEPAGACIVNCTAKEFPSLREEAREIVWPLMEWNLEAAGNVGPVYDERDPENPHLQTIRYPEMPDHNDGLGPKTLALRFKDRHEWAAVQDLELRFNRDGTGAADKYHARTDGCWPHVEEGNPNWYVYWQQVANQFGFGPMVAMEYDPDQPDGEENKGGAYVAPKTWRFDGSYVQYEKITMYPRSGQSSRIWDSRNAKSIQFFTFTVHHENGHAQSNRLPKSQGGWGSEFDFSDAWTEDTDRDGIPDSWEQAEYAQDLGFRVIKYNEPSYEEQRTHDQKLRTAWEHGWELLADAEQNKETTYTNPDGYDPVTGKGLTVQNEAQVVEKFEDIENNDWAYPVE